MTSRPLEARRPAVRVALLAGALAMTSSPSALAADAGVQLAPARPAPLPSEAPPPSDAPATSEPAAALPVGATDATQREWKLCRVEVITLLNGAGRSQVVARDHGLVFLGESLDIEREIPLGGEGRSAILRMRALLRAEAARAAGVMYRVTSEASIAGAVGYNVAEPTEQVRDAVLSFDASGTQLHEIMASDALGARLVLGITVTPVFGREAVDARLAPAPDADVDFYGFRVEALLREKDKLTTLDRADLTGTADAPATYAFTQVDRPLGSDRGVLRGNSSLEVAEVSWVEPSGFEKDHAVPMVPAGTDWVARHGVAANEDFLRDHVVELDEPSGGHSLTIRNRRNKVSSKKQAELRRQAEIAIARNRARDRASRLPSGPDVPEGYRPEGLALSMRPLHSSSGMLQVEFHLEGRLKLPHEQEVTDISSTFTEEVPRGEAFEIAVAELVREGTPEYDYVLRVTPE